MYSRPLLIALALLSLVALAGCGGLPGGGTSATNVPASNTSAPPAPGQPGALPPAATQAAGPAPGKTEDTGALPSAPRTPSPTIPAANCVDYDDFANKSFDGTYNGDLWPKVESGQAQYLTVVQHDGFLESSNDHATGQTRLDQTMTLKRPGGRTVDQLLCFEAKLRLGSAAHKAGYVSNKIRLVSDQNDVVECRLTSPQPGGPVTFTCEFIGKYVTPAVAAKYDNWHKARIELRPIVDAKSVIFNFYLDDALIGSYNTGTSQLFYSKYTPSVVVAYNSADTVGSSYVKDVKISPPTR
jgi:hypothetical protein